MFQSWEIKSLTETIPGEVQILELLVKDVTVTVLNVNQLQETMNKEPKEISKVISEQNESINKEMETIQGSQKEIPKLKSTIRYFSNILLTGHIHKLWRSQRKGPGQESWYCGHYPLWVNDTCNVPKVKGHK